LARIVLFAHGSLLPLKIAEPTCESNQTHS
jgi:hypothetical protein